MATIANGQKFLTSAPEVNTTYGGSTSLKELNTWYTMQDINNTVKPYKSLIVSNLSFAAGNILGYTVLENTMGPFTLTTYNNVLIVTFENYIDVNVTPGKVYLNPVYTFSGSIGMYCDLEESGIFSGSGTVYFYYNEIPSGTGAPYCDNCQFEIRVYN